MSEYPDSRLRAVPSQHLCSEFHFCPVSVQFPKGYVWGRVAEGTRRGVLLRVWRGGCTGSFPGSENCFLCSSDEEAASEKLSESTSWSAAGPGLGSCIALLFLWKHRCPFPSNSTCQNLPPSNPFSLSSPPRGLPGGLQAELLRHPVYSSLAPLLLLRPEAVCLPAGLGAP